MIRVLSTRPLEQQLLDQAAQKDIRIDTISFISTEPIQDEMLTQQIRQLGSQSLTAVFTSMNAVEAVAGPAGSVENSPAPWKIFCIGAATRHLVETHFGATAVAGTAPSASELADVIIGHHPAEVYFFCGDQRRDELPEKLTTAGVHVHELVVYRTIQTPQTVKNTYDGIVFFSPSAVHSFFAAAGNNVPAKTILFAIGRTTADAIRTYSRNPIITGSNPEKDALVKQLIDHFQNSI